MWTSKSRPRSTRLPCDMCQEPIPSPSESSNQAEQTMYKCQVLASQTKEQGSRYADLVPVLFPSEDGFVYTRDVCAEGWT